MGGCHGIHVELFTVAGGAAMKITTIGAGDAFLLKALVAGKRLIAVKGQDIADPGLMVKSVKTSLTQKL